MSNPYYKNAFPEITPEQWEKIAEFTTEVLGFPVDRISGNLYRECWEVFKVDELKSKLNIAIEVLEKYKTPTAQKALKQIRGGQ